ncbi:hypothetical protein ABMA28_010748 [Loxostege sticticalis]|uniref:C2H2-type domain-containing protein n=1 Tax=Loxostege sticticalis TaxID=481309 RepID=A0ABD0S9A0_LOXSC
MTSFSFSGLKADRAEGSAVKLSENVTIRRRTGKGKKLFVYLQDQSNLNCPVATCTKSFLSSTLLKAHIRKVHYSEKKHMCEVCGASFTAQYLLRRHSAVHATERVQCPVCKKMLITGTDGLTCPPKHGIISYRTISLAQHLRSHSDTRRHECVSCGKWFLRSSTLKVHRKTAHKEAM